MGTSPGGAGAATGPPTPRAFGTEGNSVDITGYNVKRDEFEPEYDNLAEVPLGDMETREDDPPHVRERKLKMLTVYAKRLAQRQERRTFILERGLLNVKKQQALEKKRSREENDLRGRMRVFARFQSPEEHEALVQGLLREQSLRGRMRELKTYRASGVVTLAEAEFFEQDRRRRDAERQARGAEGKAGDASYLRQPAFKSSSAMRANRYLNRHAAQGMGPPLAPGAPTPTPGLTGGGAGGAPASEGPSGEGAVVSAPGAPSRELQSLRGAGTSAGGGGAGGGGGGGMSAVPMHGGIPALGLPSLPDNLALVSRPGTQAPPLSLAPPCPFADAISEAEARLCEENRVLPVQLVAAKAKMMQVQAIEGRVTAEAARQVERVDAHKLATIRDLLIEEGLVNP